MRFAKGDKIPIGQASVSALSIDPAPKTKSDERAAVEAGLGRNTIRQFRSRHPELAHWSQERIIEQAWANKDQREVARRQGSVAGGPRGRFGKLTYDEGDNG